MTNTTEPIYTKVNDVVGKIKVKETTDGRTEVVYVANSTNNSSKVKLKTYYERKAPTFNGETLWENSTLDIFSPGQGGILGTTYQTGYYVNNILEINDEYPTKIYFVDKDNNKLSIYRNNPSFTPVPPPFVDCSTQNDWHNGFEGRIRDSQLLEESYANVTNNSKENVGFLTISNNVNAIFPNPTDGIFNIQLSNNWCGANIRIIDGIGRVIKEKNDVCESIQMNLSDAPKGIYFVQFSLNDKVETTKIIKN